MSEFNSRVEAQRNLLKVVNNQAWSREQLFSLSEKAIDRWSAVNRLERSSKLVGLLRDASARIFVMANHSDDPICGSYRLSKNELLKIADDLRSAIVDGRC